MQTDDRGPVRLERAASMNEALEVIAKVGSRDDIDETYLYQYPLTRVIGVNLIDGIDGRITVSVSAQSGVSRVISFDLEDVSGGEAVVVNNVRVIGRCAVGGF